MRIVLMMFGFFLAYEAACELQRQARWSRVEDSGSWWLNRVARSGEEESW